MRRSSFPRALVLAVACICPAPGPPGNANRGVLAAGEVPAHRDTGLQAGILVFGKIGDACLFDSGWPPQVPGSAR